MIKGWAFILQIVENSLNLSALSLSNLLHNITLEFIMCDDYSDAFKSLQYFYMRWMELYAEYSFHYDNESAAHLADESCENERNFDEIL